MRDTTGIRSLTPHGHVGFDTFPDQLVKKSLQQGFTFNILCIGETGLGKSTLINSLFNTNFDGTQTSHALPGVRLRSNIFELQEKNVKLKLTLVETVGYGDQINKEDSFKTIVDYIDTQFESYLQEELKVQRSLSAFHDTRIHACLYLICPTGHGLKSIDLLCMKKLDNKVNIIPVIAKSDVISKAELQHFKIKVMSELVANGIQIYQFPTDDENVAELNANMNKQVPFAVVGSTDTIKFGNKMIRARQYTWGIVQVENENHCDFVKLREMLLRTNMEDLREQTHSCHYQLYRRLRLEQMGFSDLGADNKPVPFHENYEKKRQEQLELLQQREEEMRQSFVFRVKEKESELKEAEKSLLTKYENMNKQLEQEKHKIEDQNKKLEEEMNDFNKKKEVFLHAQNQPQSHGLTLGWGKKK
ncbi:septin-2-like [Limulus polyphemus]|uniref:Septin n=1 Tax=Limulus polyphemus TaxID=6850 RepID=A0ABM1BZ25_LIMPO|nr:septin-2-like [Limulus polyphemus]